MWHQKRHIGPDIQAQVIRFTVKTLSAQEQCYFMTQPPKRYFFVTAFLNVVVFCNLLVKLRPHQELDQSTKY